MVFVFGGRRQAVFEFQRGAVTEGAVSATGVIEGLDVIEDHELSGVFGRGNGVPEAFGFEGGDKAFCQGVVIGIAAATHAGGDPMELELVPKGAAGILNAAIAVMKEAAARRLPLD